MDWLVEYADGDLARIKKAKHAKTPHFKVSDKRERQRKLSTTIAATTAITAPPSRNNSRVSLLTDPVARRRVQGIQPLVHTVFVDVPATRCCARANLTRNKHKGILLHEGASFYVLALPGAQTIHGNNEASSSSGNRMRCEKVWVYVRDRGVIQVLWEEVRRCMQNPVSDRVCAKVSCRGSVRLVPQKVGVKSGPNEKMVRCFRLDFGEASEANRWLWVEEEIVLGMQQTYQINDRSGDEAVVVKILCELASMKELQIGCN